MESVFLRKAYDFMAEFQAYPLMRDFNTFLHLNVFHVVKGHFSYDRINEFPFNVLSVRVTEPGEGNFFENMETGEVIKRDLDSIFLIPSHTRVHYKINDDHTFIALHFNLTFLSGDDLFRETSQLFTWKDPELRHRLLELLTPGNDTLRGICRLKSLILELCSRCLPEIDRKKLKAQERWLPAIRYMQSHLHAALSVEEIAEACGMRSDVFSRKFKQDMGIAPKRFLENHLSRKLSEEIVSSELSIKELSCKYRFCSEFYFSNFFKRMTGIAPLELRRKFGQSMIHF